MLKIIGLLTALVIIIATLSVGTFAYFNDVTTVSNNTITAGTLTLAADGGTPVAISLSNKKPTDGGNAGSFVLVAGGTLNGTLEIDISAITNNENTRDAVETSSGDTSNGALTGELGAKLKMAIWLDTNGNGVLNTDEKYMDATANATANWTGGDGTAPTYAAAPSIFFAINSFNGGTYENVKTGFTGTAGTARVEYHFPNDPTKTNGLFYDDNQAQSDGVAFDVIFVLEQS
jgi:predicted ribosomally synthesized peptide with SipW-like signal peptide